MGAKAAELEALKEKVLAEIAAAGDAEAVENLRVTYVGRKGQITGILRDMGSVPPEERREVGQTANAVKAAVAAALKERQGTLNAPQGAAAERPDITLPGRTTWTGGLHPLTLVINEIKDIFFGMGFSLATGPDVESDYYNFEALNFPADHPARDMQDTLVAGDDLVLRTQTSSVQIRTMEKTRPPVRVIAPGRCYRKDETDATHSPMFQQVEGLYVDKGVTFAQLKGTLLTFARKMFGDDVNIRFRNGFFPFTEPSAEYDITCVSCRGAGCRVCKGTGWIEIAGAGMVDPNVFGFVDYDPEVYTGFAFGMGIERIAMIKYGINDIRLFYENDRRFLEQFRQDF